MILAHGGGGLPFYSYMPEVRDYLDKVWFDTAAFPFLYDNDILRGLISTVGSDKIIFGSDFPLIPQEKVISYIEGSSIDQDDKRKIFCDNLNDLLENNTFVG